MYNAKFVYKWMLISEYAYFDLQIYLYVWILYLQISIFSYLMLYNYKPFVWFNNLNQQNKILKFTKPKSTLRQNAKFEHFERILHHSTKNRKYAKYEGLFFGKTLVAIGVLGQKTMSGKNVVLEKKEPETPLFLM